MGLVLTNAPILAAWQFAPETYGAKGDGTTNDTTAIKSAVNAAVAYAQAHNGYAEVVFSPLTYLISGALAQGGATKGNAQIPLPVIAGTAAKITLALRGVTDASALPHWNQTVGQRNGTILRTTITGTNDGTYGVASVVGGPTPEQGYGFASGAGVFSNMLVVLDGIAMVSATTNPTMSGFDFRGLAQAHVVSGSALCDAGTGTVSSTNITNQWTFGLAMPQELNNAKCDVDFWSCEGFCYGIDVAEHTVAQSVRCVYCIVGIAFSAFNYGHNAVINYACVEACQTSLLIGGNGRLDIACMDIENGSGVFAPYMHILDSSNVGKGTIGWSGNGEGDVPLVSGAANLKIKNLNVIPGVIVTPTPSVPSTTVALLNPYWRDAVVMLSGGTVTAITVGGTTTGLTSGMVIVPSGRTITLTYSVAPTWIWVLL